ncbi:Protoporphyrinogen IX oxidase menaquinone-dependent contains flavodoxin domain [Methanonatronarchaeum thermophilum]|uniref:Protoporphyrinogen IX oxidase menaquinone-dependent contains flavodoxin domain n=1 Tax=Methanonatronarchaeum thermophilum TaxID=1927129 RepID=A0A1Y3GEC4_9EURY|nr:menaquinone-dependent protoporphyrinogen IX dehydrogenase [Methanonatronarchaeum thermophilum]OUJ18653.1 Protoporphyrinogen IX oxidase menaquinone-dependent contains flavodoxin domain [Methanonatronarchaeum thermophilum]
MSKVVLLYGSSEGQTEKIIQNISEKLNEFGHKTDVYDLKNSKIKIDLSGYDGAIVGASIHVGKHQKYVVNYVDRNVERLNQIPTAFFTVNLTAHDKSEEAKQNVDKMIEEFLTLTKLEPEMTKAFPGALKFSRYGFIKRLFMKIISKKLTDGDTSEDIEFTDWVEVDEFAKKYSELLYT